MSEIIQKWVEDTIGVTLDMSPNVFPLLVRDGRVISQILNRYNIIDSEYMSLIRESDSPRVCFDNLIHLQLIFQVVDIDFSDHVLNDIVQLRGNAAIKLFYELYLILHDKKQLLMLRFPSEIIFPSQVSTMHDHGDDPSKMFVGSSSGSLIKKTSLIKWHDNYYINQYKKLKAMKQEYIKYIEDRYVDRRELLGSQYDLEVECDVDEDEYSYRELVEYHDLMKDSDIMIPDAKTAKSIVKEVQHKTRKKLSESSLKVYMKKLLLIQFWEEILSKQGKEYEESVFGRVLKQSKLGRRVALQMFEERQQKCSMIEQKLILSRDAKENPEHDMLESMLSKGRQIDMERYTYYVKKKHNLELHAKLYKRKRIRKTEKIQDMCCVVVWDIVDLALKNVEFKVRYGEEASGILKKSWTDLFIHEKPLLDEQDVSEDLVSMWTAKDDDDIVGELFDRFEPQQYLDQKNLYEYINFDPPWHISQIEDFVDFVSINCFHNIMGHIVHRLLLTKYPKPLPPPPADTPEVQVAVCLRGLDDLMVVPLLRKYLANREIEVILIDDIIEHCLAVYKKETTMEYESEGSMDDEEDVEGEELLETEIDEVYVELADKENQTPYIYPDEDIVLSVAGGLGKIAFDILDNGEIITDNLLIAMLMEYLKTLKGKKGWVLVNYPTDIGQAIMLEEALTAKAVPYEYSLFRRDTTMSIGDFNDLYFSSVDTAIKEEKFADYRQSKILPNPNPLREEPFYDTFLTAYVHIKHESEIQPPPNPYVVGDEPPPDLLDDFYTKQGCNYSMTYSTFDTESVKQLAKLIIGDYSMPPKTSLEILGEMKPQTKSTSKVTLLSPKDLSIKQKPGVSDVTQKGQKAPVKSSSLNKVKKSSKSKSIILYWTHENKGVQVPEPEPKPSLEVLLEEPVPLPKPGEEYWFYIDLPLPENLQVALATFWESVENVYITEFQEVFFVKRRTSNTISPYLTYVQNHMKLFLERPNTMQLHLHQFQTKFNAVNDEIRGEKDIKKQLHCKNAELREKLWHVCDKEMMECERERIKIINTNWVSSRVCELVNNYILAMQLELDRSFDTLQVMKDYYTNAILKVTCFYSQSVMDKPILQKIENQDGDLINQEWSKSICALLKEPGSNPENIAIHRILLEKYAEAKNYVIDAEKDCLGDIEDIEVYFNPKLKLKPSLKHKKLPVLNSELMENGPILVQEWTGGVKGEFCRIRLRLQLIYLVALNDLNYVLTSAKNMFHTIYNSILRKYEKALYSIKTACQVFSYAIEAEVALQPQLLFVGEKFVVDPSMKLFSSPLPIVDPFVENLDDYIFTTSQLSAISHIMMDLVPYDSIPKKYFEYLIQDMILPQGVDDGPPIVPPAWKLLKNEQVFTLIKRMFGESVFISWKDFVVLNLPISFPTEAELLYTREQFRERDPDCTELVSEQDFYKVKFWFETRYKVSNPDQVFSIICLKQILFYLFQTDDNSVNYTTLLLSFCKDTNPVLGFAKALELSLGKRVCWSPNVGQAFVKSVKDQRKLDEIAEIQRLMEHEQNVADVQSMLSSALATTFHVCDSVLIEDYMLMSVNEEEEEEEQQETCQGFSESLSETLSSEVKMEVPVEFLFRGSNCDEESQSMISEEVFSNIEIGFECTGNPPLAFFLPLQLVFIVLTASLPCHIRLDSDKEEVLYQQIKCLYEEFRSQDFNGAVLTHEFLNDERFKSIIRMYNKFVVSDPVEIVKGLVTNKKINFEEA